MHVLGHNHLANHCETVASGRFIHNTARRLLLHVDIGEYSVTPY
jgi:hypothetical protein